MKIVTWNINGIRARLGNFTHWLRESAPDIVCLQEIKSRRRAVPARRGRGARLQCRDARPERLQRRRAAVEAAVRRGDARPARRSGRRAGALHRRRVLDRHRARCASPRSICPTATRSMTRRNSRTSCHGWRGWRTGPRSRLALEEPLVLAGDYNVIPEPIDARFPENWVNDALFQPETAAGLPPAGQSRLHRRHPLRHRRAADLHVLGLSGRRLAEEQRHPHRPSDAVAGSGRPARLGLDRKTCPRLGKAVRPRAGGDRTGAVGASAAMPTDSAPSAGRATDRPWLRISCASAIAVRRSASGASEKASSCMPRIHGWSSGAARSSAAVIMARPRTTLPLWNSRLPSVACAPAWPFSAASCSQRAGLANARS